MAELELENLVKIYPFMKVQGLFSARKKAQAALERQKARPYTTNEGVIAVQQFSLSIEHGEFVVLLGPSGCGKSTVLRMIAGLETVSGGVVRMDGEDITEAKSDIRDIAMTFQNYALYSHMNVYDNIAYPLKNQHIPRHEIREQVLRTAELLKLTKLLERRPKDLSGGEQQRVAIGRALVRKPKLFLLDEPFSNLDVSLRQSLRQELKRIHEALDTTFIYVTHDQTEAFMLGTKIVVMQDGLIEQAGTPRQLYNHPQNAYVASFIGTPQMNMLQGVLHRENDAWTVQTMGQTYTLSSEQSASLAPADDGADVQLGIRPVHIKVYTETGAGIEAEVFYTEQTGTETVLYLRAGNTELTAVVPAEGSAVRFTRHTKVRLILPPNRFHLFDPATGAAVS